MFQSFQLFFMEQSQKSGINVYIGNMMSQFSLQYIVDVCHSFPPVFERIFPGQNQGYSQFDRKYFTGFCHHLCHGGSKLSLLQPLFELKFIYFSFFRNKCYDFVNRWNWGNRPECSPFLELPRVKYYSNRPYLWYLFTYIHIRK